MADGYVERGIGLTTIGVGLDADIGLMRNLAEHGAGNFYFLEDGSAAMEVFKQELAYFITPLALDIHIDAVAGQGFNFGEVIGSTLWQASTRAGSMHIPAAFVASRTGPAPDPGTGGRRGGGSMLFIHLDPTAMNFDGKVADLTLNYKVPGSSQVITQALTLTYAGNPSETPAETYLSQPEMAPRFAMYNMFLGLRAAVQDTNFNCATVALNATRAAAKTWNVTQENPDIAADITMIDTYLANLKTHGATATESTTFDTCQGYGNGYGGYDGGNDYYPGNDYHDQAYACSSTGRAPGAAFMIGLAVLVAVRRRRRPPAA
jgi:Ca-activated chloride channel family protein